MKNDRQYQVKFSRFHIDSPILCESYESPIEIQIGDIDEESGDGYSLFFLSEAFDQILLAE